MPDSLVTDRVSAEHSGVARAFINKMTVATVAAAAQMHAIADDAFATLKRRHSAGIKSIKSLQDVRRVERIGLRPDYVLSIETNWRGIPALGRVGFSLDRPDKHSIIISDTRISSRRIGCYGWDDPDSHEYGIVLTTNTLTISRDAAKKESVVIASLSLHAISRRFQRGFDIGESAIIADLVTLAAVAPGLIERGKGEFSVPVPDGAWVGSVEDFADRPTQQRRLAANVRSFL